jgi:tRNA pseudouridine synthase 10
MKPEQDVLKKAEAILAKYLLCNSCLGRQFATKRGESSSLGKRIKKHLGVKESKQCGLCGGIIDNLDEISERVIEGLKDYEFKTFQSGTSIESLLLENEDSLRAEFKLKGGASVKTEITRGISERIARVSHKKLSQIDPDIAIVVSPAERLFTIMPRSVHVYGRYRKTKRGLPQKRPKCEECGGRGCPTCAWKGFARTSSVESILADNLISSFDGKKVRFSWVGSEDDQSLVLGEGRPFYADIYEPKKRKVSRDRLKARLAEGVEMVNVKMLPKKPVPDIPFELLVEANVKASKNMKPSDLQRLSKTFRNVEIKQYSANKQRFLTKKIKSMTTKTISRRRFVATISCEGGINIKKLVMGSNAEVSPNISEVLGYQCNTDSKRPFDILDVRVLKRPIAKTLPVVAETPLR